MSAAHESDRSETDFDPGGSSDQWPSGVQRISSVSIAAHRGRASSPEIGEAPVDNGVRGLRLILGFWILVAVAVAGWLAFR
jgi:hypothetical protein